MYKLDKKYLYLFLIVLLGFLLRFYRLLDFPVQLNHDEVSQLYDAISIAQTGRDIYGNFLPVMMKSVNDFKSPFYTYITSLFYFIFGGGELTIRLPGAFFGTMIIFAVYFFVLKLLKNSKIALLASFFTAIAPFEIFFSRKSFENVTGIFFMLLGFTSLLIYFEKRNSQRWLYLASGFLGFAMYTYFSHAIIIPLLLVTFVLIFRDGFQGKLKKYITSVFIFLVFFIPLLFLILTNPDVRNRSQAVFITQDINLGKQTGYGNKYKAIFDFSLNRYLDQFNPVYIFGEGLDLTNQGPLGCGPLFLLQLPFVVLGIIYLLRLPDFTKEKKFILAWVVIGMLPSGLTFEPHSPHRSIIVFTMFNIISAAGLYFLCKKVRSLIRISIIGLAFFINFIYFLHIYFVNFPYEKSESMHYPFEQVAQFAWSLHDQVDQIVFDPLYGETAPVIGTAAHYYIAYYGNFPPAKFQKEYRAGTKEREVLFDKFSIRKIDWRSDQYLKNTLFIGSIWSLPIDSIEKSKIVKIFYFYNKYPAFYAVRL